MKSSKLFLGATAFSLAAVGAMASKTHNQTRYTTGYTKLGNGTCPNAVTQIACSDVQNSHAFCTGGVQKQLWTVGCSQKLFTTGGTN